MKGHLYVISSGVIALGLLGGNVSFNMTQCKLLNGTNVSIKIMDHVCIFEWCESVCHTSGVLLSVTPWIVIFTMCMFLFAYCIPCKPPQSDNNPLCGIGASFQALSLDHHDSRKPVQHHSTSASSWLHELHRLELLNGSRYTPSLVVRNAKNKPLLAPSRFNCGHSSQSSQSQCSAECKTATSTSNNCRGHYYIITLLLFVLFISVVTNIGLVFWIITS